MFVRSEKAPKLPTCGMHLRKTTRPVDGPNAPGINTIAENIEHKKEYPYPPSLTTSSKCQTNESICAVMRTNFKSTPNFGRKTKSTKRAKKKKKIVFFPLAYNHTLNA